VIVAPFYFQSSNSTWLKVKVRLTVEGPENLRRRGPHRNSGIELIPKSSSLLEENTSLPEGKETDKMAAGSSRIIRYVLFAFFVGRFLYQSNPASCLTVVSGCYDSLLHILLLDTEADA